MEWPCRECSLRTKCPYNSLSECDILKLTAELSHLRADLARLERERDAAVKMLCSVRDCHTCKHYIRDYGIGGIECKKPCQTARKNNYEFRGTEETR